MSQDNQNQTHVQNSYNMNQIDLASSVNAQYTYPHITPRKNKTGWIVFVVLSLILFLLFVIGGGTLLYFSYTSALNNPGSNSTQSNNNSNNSSSKLVISDGKFYSSSIYTPEEKIVALIKNAAPAVVTVIVKEPDQSLGEYIDITSRETLAGGTGFFIAEDGLLITNQHVVCGASARDIMIVTNENKTYSVSSVEVEPAQDIAILRVNTNGNKFPHLRFANPDSPVMVGQEVIAIGNPFGDNPGSVTRGIISGIGRNIVVGGDCGKDGDTVVYAYEGMLQTDAAINSGNSGGPLLNMNGEVIGVNSAGILLANNIGYTIPHTTVLRILDRYLKNNNKIVSPFLGITHRMIDSSVAAANGVPVGAYVSRVEPNSPADKAGIKAGDIITKIGDHKIDFSLVSTLTLYFEPGQKTTVEVYRIPQKGELRDGRYLTLEITIGRKDQMNRR